MFRYATVITSGGTVGFVSGPRGLVHVLLSRRGAAGVAKTLQERFPEARHDPGLLRGFQRQLRDYFDGRPVRFQVKVDLGGLSAFHRRVLEGCAAIAYGRTLTYGELARRVGHPRAARAVGRAMACNPVPLVVPCHRVVASDGSPGGFSAEEGVSLKRRLLAMESGSSVGARSRRSA